MIKSKRKPRRSAVKSTKDDMVKMRVSAGDKQALADAAKRAGLDLSVWLRQLALREAGVLPEAK